MKPPRAKIPNLYWEFVGPEGAKVLLGRWKPGPSLRKRGFKNVAFWNDGPAFTADDCRAVGFETLLPLRHRLAGAPRPVPMEPSAAVRLARRMNALAREMARESAAEERKCAPRIHIADAPLSALAAEYRASDQFKALRPKTRESYASHLRALEATFGPEPPLAITAETILAHHGKAREKRGRTAANMDLQVLRVALNWAKKRDKWRALTPDRDQYTQLGVGGGAARLRVALPAEIDALMRAFDDPAAIYAAAQTPLGDRILRAAPEGGDAMMLMLYTAARVNDALSMRAEAFNGETIIYQPSKSLRKGEPGKILEIKVVAPLAARLADAARRRRAIFGAGDPAWPEIVIDAREKRPFWREEKSGVRRHKPFNALWRERAALAALIEPSIAGAGTDRLGRPLLALNAQDMRDTAVTRLVEADCTIFEISSWHGSDPKVILSLVRNYIEIGPARAAEAGAKLMASLERQGVAI